MNQHEFDNKVADILVLGLNFSETWENIGKLYLSLSEDCKKFAYESKILKAFTEAKNRDIYQHILNKK